MKRAVTLVSMSLSLLGCSSDAPATGSGGLPGVIAAITGGGASAVGGTSSTGGTSPSGGTPAPATGGNSAASGGSSGGSPSIPGSGGGGGSGGSGNGSGGAISSGGSGPGDGGTRAGGSGGTSEPPPVIPPPVTVPYVWGVGLGVTDMPAAVDFYTKVMKMTVERKDVDRDDRTETVLYASGAKRGSRLVLMKFDDARSTRKITAKLVWQAQSPSAIARAASEYPDYVSRLTGLIVQFDGPETYIQEVGNLFDTEGGGIAVPYLIAMGMAVSDQAASRKFYTTAFGMTESRTGTFTITDATGRASITEYTAQYSTRGGAAIVLQAWTPERNAAKNPVKIVLFVPDAEAAASKVVAAGGKVVKAAERTPVYENRKCVVTSDLDGYVIELVE